LVDKHQDKAWKEFGGLILCMLSEDDFEKQNHPEG